MSDEIFDPEIHAVDKDGNPSLNKDGSFRKKRRDAGQGKAGRKSSSAPRASSGKGGSQRDAYKRSVAGLLQVPATLLSLVDPVDGYCAAQLVDPWSEALSDLAVEYPQLAAAIERASVAGPLAGVIGVGLLTVMQFGSNHGKVPENVARMFGARPRAEIEQLLKQRGVELAAEAEQQQREDAEDEAEAQAVTEMMQRQREHGYAAAV
jgi:hypothetical protein